jgi:hypothetical protein
MSVTGQVTYLRRFAGKFVEIVAAGIGTAVSGYLVAHFAVYFSFFSFLKPAVEPTAPQAISSQAEPRDTASIESTVRAALANHDVNRAAPIVATPQPPAPASAEIAAPETLAAETPPPAAAAAPPLATAEIKSLPVVADIVDQPTPEQNGWQSGPAPVRGGITTMLPPQPPPVHGNLFSALKHFADF